MRPYRDCGAGQPEAIDETRVIECVAVNTIAFVQETGEDTNVELESTWEEHRIGIAGKLSKRGFGGSVVGEIATNQTRCSRAKWRPHIGGEGFVGETEVVVATKADDRATIEGVVEPVACCDGGWCAGEAKVGELA